MEQLIAEVVLEIKGVKSEIRMRMKDSGELEDCPVNTIIIILTIDGNQWTGRFGSYDGEGVSLKSVDGDSRALWFEEYQFNQYLEEIITCECEDPEIKEDENGINYCVDCKVEIALLNPPKG